MAPPYRILLAEDHVIFREMIKKNLKEMHELDVVGEVGDGLELLTAIDTLNPQMVILDIGLPQLSGLDAAKKIKQDHPEIKILLLTMYKSRDYFSYALEVGVDGYLLKEDAFKDLVTAIDTIRGGGTYISSLLSHHVMDRFGEKFKGRGANSQQLTPREIEVLRYFAAGKSNKEIAELLSISQSTLRIHLSNIKRKLFAKTDVELIKYALKKGYVSLT